MVDHYIDHEVHLSLVQGIGKCNQVCLRAKVWTELGDILRPITMVSFPVSGNAFDVGNDW